MRIDQIWSENVGKLQFAIRSAGRVSNFHLYFHILCSSSHLISGCIFPSKQQPHFAVYISGISFNFLFCSDWAFSGKMFGRGEDFSFWQFCVCFRIKMFIFRQHPLRVCDGECTGNVYLKKIVFFVLPCRAHPRINNNNQSNAYENSSILLRCRIFCFPAIHEGIKIKHFAFDFHTNKTLISGAYSVPQLPL